MAARLSYELALDKVRPRPRGRLMRDLTRLGRPRDGDPILDRTGQGLGASDCMSPPTTNALASSNLLTCVQISAILDISLGSKDAIAVYAEAS
jgi:hypothetical protein